MSVQFNTNLLNANMLLGMTNNQAQKQDSFAGLNGVDTSLEAVLASSYQSNLETSTADFTEVNAGLRDVLAKYEEVKNEFLNDFDDNMSELSASAAKLKNYNFNVEKEGAISTVTNTDKNGNVTETTKYSTELKAAIDTVKDFVKDYNNTLQFFGDYAGVSKRIDIMATTFGDTTFRAANYSSIGLTTNTDGSFTINESVLANAILNDPDKVSNILGKDGLAGKTEDHIKFANGQRDQLFPSAKVMLGDQFNQAAMYSSKNIGNITAVNNIGNLLNMMF